MVKTMVLYKIVAHFTISTYGVNQAFRFVEGFWLHRKGRQISEKTFFTSSCAICSESILHKYHGKDDVL